MNFYKVSLIIFLFIIKLFLSFPIVGNEKNNICLTMIVKNEEKIIQRCLESAKGIIDFVVICDTGSTDNTVQIVENYLKENNIPGKVFNQEWKNFGYNRTLAIETAQKTLKNLGLSLNDTFFLLLDADMLLEVSPEFDKENLHADTYLVCQTSDVLSYYNTRLIRASLPWKSVGVTHEYWSCPSLHKQERLETIQIDDREDGGSKADKFERDIKLLEQGLKDEPNNMRYMFYLAQSYKSLKIYPEAIKWYKTRIEKGGWHEEVWYAKYMIGECHEAMGNWDQAFLNYIEAFQLNPNRSEPLHHIAKHYRMKKQYDLAYLFAKQGSEIPYPEGHILFISHPVYDHLFDEEISISAYYTPFKGEGYAAANRLCLKKGIPKDIKELAMKNMLFYAQPLENATYRHIEIDLPRVHEKLSTRYNPMNPSIIKTENGFEVICRTVNYCQIGAKHFQSLDYFDPNNTIKTRNFFVKYDPELNLLDQKEIIEELPRQRTPITHIKGLEDCRLFSYQNSKWFTCTTLDTNIIGMHQISLCKLSDQTDGSKVFVEKLLPLKGPNFRRCEKNWLPFTKDNEIFFIYLYDPFTIYKLDQKNGELVLFKKEETEYDFSTFSGSASPIEFDDGYLFLIHETLVGEKRNYIHRFVYLDKDLNFKQISKPFIFLHQGIEYCCGIAVDHSNSKLIMTLGMEDREAFFCLVPLETVRKLLEPIENILD